MTKDELIRMAIECQLVTTGNRDGLYMEALEKFADLVRAKAKAEEREACEMLCKEYFYAYQVFDAIQARGQHGNG